MEKLRQVVPGPPDRSALQREPGERPELAGLPRRLVSEAVPNAQAGAMASQSRIGGLLH